MADNIQNDEYTVNNFQVDYLTNARSINESEPTPSSDCPFFNCNCSQWVIMQVSGKTLNLRVDPRKTATT